MGADRATYEAVSWRLKAALHGSNRTKDKAYAISGTPQRKMEVAVRRADQLPREH